MRQGFIQDERYSKEIHHRRLQAWIKLLLCSCPTESRSLKHRQGKNTVLLPHLSHKRQHGRAAVSRPLSWSISSSCRFNYQIKHLERFPKGVFSPPPKSFSYSLHLTSQTLHSIICQSPRRWPPHPQPPCQFAPAQPVCFSLMLFMGCLLSYIKIL